MRRLLLIPSLILALFLGFSGHAQAQQRQGVTPAGGTLLSTVYSFTAIGAEGRNTFYEAKWNAVIKGTLGGSVGGSCSAIETGLIAASGNWNAVGLAMCTGTVHGKQGTFNFSFHNHLDPNLYLHGKFQLQGTGTLAGVSGHGTLAGTPVYDPATHKVTGQSIIYIGSIG
jgi:hypothetical protein